MEERPFYQITNGNNINRKSWNNKSNSNMLIIPPFSFPIKLPRIIQLLCWIKWTLPCCWDAVFAAHLLLLLLLHLKRNLLFSWVLHRFFSPFPSSCSPFYYYSALFGYWLLVLQVSTKVLDALFNASQSSNSSFEVGSSNLRVLMAFWCFIAWIEMDLLLLRVYWVQHFVIPKYNQGLLHLFMLINLNSFQILGFFFWVIITMWCNLDVLLLELSRGCSNDVFFGNWQ